jgi:hypothetical protein
MAAATNNPNTLFFFPFIFSLQLALLLSVVLVETMMESKGPK